MSDESQHRTPGDYKAAIVKLDHTDPILHQAMTLYRRSDVTYEQALEMAVVHLIKGNQTLMEQLKRLMMTTPVRYFPAGPIQ